MAEVFISYANRDLDRARQLAERLAAHGYEVWWDRTIPPGRVFDEVIQEALHAAKCVIVLWSAESVRSNWVKTEAAEGMSPERLVPAFIERVQPPIEFKRIQAADLSDWSGEEDHPEYRKLLASVDGLLRWPGLEGGQTAPPISVAEQAYRSAPRPSRAGWVAAAVIALVLVAAGSYLLGKRGSAPSAVLDAGTTRSPVRGQSTGTSSSVAQPPPQPEPVASNKQPGKAGRVNLLAPENGGEILVASSERWVATIDGNEDTYAWIENGQAVFGFKDGRTASFDTFAVLIPSTSDYNVGEFELLAGNDGPDGKFTSLGTFKTQNVRNMKQPFQAFRFSPVKAKFLKFRSLKASGAASAGVIAYEFQLLGTLDY
jgi:hypothetical protein